VLYELSRKGFRHLPPMLDYEGEAGIYFPRAVDRSELTSKTQRGIAVELFAANDLTYRSVQILGEGQFDRLGYWETAKSVSTANQVSFQRQNWLLDLDRWPSIQIKSYVNGVIKQNSNLQEIIFTPREMLLHFMDYLEVDAIPSGVALLTGTPAGCVFQASCFKKYLAKIFGLSRTTKLKSLIREDRRYLAAGDIVDVFVGSMHLKTYINGRYTVLGSERAFKDMLS